MKVNIVGAGIMGLSTAWALRRRGHQVAVYDQGPIPNSRASSVDQHRLIRYPYGAEDGYCLMVGEAYAAWERLWRDLGRSYYIETGTLALSNGDGHWVATTRAGLTRCNVDYEVIYDTAIADRFPFLSVDDRTWGCYLPSGGMLLAGEIMAALARHTARAGVVLDGYTRIDSVDPERATLKLANGNVISGDALLIAAGPWTNNLLPAMQRRMTPSRQCLVYLTPPDRFAAAWQSAPMLLDNGSAIGFYAVPPRQVAGLGDYGLKIGDHRFSLQGDPDDDREAEAVEIGAVRAQCAARLRDFQDYRTVSARACYYDVEPAEHFIVEPLSRSTWVMTGFSGHGFKFGALLGEQVAAALDGARPASAVTRWAAGIRADN